MTAALIVFILYCVVAIADCYTTYIALEKMTGFAEANRVAAWLMDKIGVFPAIALFSVLQLPLFYMGLMSFPKLWFVGLIPLAWRTHVVMNNFRLIRNAKS